MVLPSKDQNKKWYKFSLSENCKIRLLGDFYSQCRQKFDHIVPDKNQRRKINEK